MAKGLFLTIKRVLKEYRVGVLATAGTPYPYASLIAFAYSEDLRELVFATLRRTRKYRNMRKNAHVSFLINSAVNTARNLKNAVAVTALGSVTDIKGKKRHQYQALLIQRHPGLRPFLERSDCALMVLVVDKYVLVDRFERVRELTVARYTTSPRK